MPYIRQEDREKFKPILKQLWDIFHHIKPGEMAYLIWNILIMYRVSCGHTYQHFVEMLGVLESLKLELYERFIKLYEQGKLQENGDVLIIDLLIGDEDGKG